MGLLCWTKYPIHVKSFKTVDARASGLNYTTPSWAWRWPRGWYQKLSVMFFQRAIMLNKIPKIHFKSFKTVDARASGLHLTTPSWAWSWPWGWYQKLSVMFFQRAIMLNKIPKIHFKSFKTVDARASGRHFTTPSWAWSWPWGWYKKLSIIFFHRASVLNKIPKIHG